MVERAIDDEFLEFFFSRIPRRVAVSFDDDQLLAIKTAFATRWHGTHSIDIRLSLPLPFRRYYFVLVAGPEKRTPARRRADAGMHSLVGLANGLFAVSLGVFLLTSFLGVLYVVKSALGIDLLPDAHLGIWDDLREQVRLMFR